MPNNNLFAVQSYNHDWLDNVYNLQASIDSLHSIASEKNRKTKTMAKPVKNILSPIYEVLKVKSYTKDKTESVIGVELENEWIKEPPDWPKAVNFIKTDDASLRYYGVEYVSKPLPYTKYKDYLGSLCKQLKEKLEPPTNSIRTSIHVHFDVTQYSFIDVLNFATCYWILEGFLSSFAGSHRQGNLFCLRLKDAIHIQSYIKEILSEYKLKTSTLLSSDLRYASVNFAALQKFGTLEFRLMRGTIDFDEICLWIDALEAIRKFALQFENPRNIYNFFMKEISAEQLPKVVLGENIFNALKTYSGEIDAEQIREYFDQCHTIFFCSSYDFLADLKLFEEEERQIEKILEEKKKKQLLWNSNIINYQSLENEEIVEILYTSSSFSVAGNNASSLTNGMDL